MQSKSVRRNVDDSSALISSAIFQQCPKQKHFSVISACAAAYWAICGYIVMLRARMFRSLIIRTRIKERNIRAHNITI